MDFSKFMFNIICFLLWFSLRRPCHGTETDIQCLLALRSSLKDPSNSLQSWNFSNTTEGFICKFNGIECWHVGETRVLNLRLPNMNLEGEFPPGLALCTSMTGLDLSSNYLSGSLPQNISKIVPFVTSLDLSFNNFSGEIPVSLANCSFINTLNLQNNQLGGSIPLELAGLQRLVSFNVANNRLSGLIPFFNKSASINVDNNPGLCGAPLDRACTASKPNRTPVILGSAVGGVVFTFLVVGVILYFFLRRLSIIKKDEDVDGNKWAKNIKGKKAFKVSMFENTVSKMKLSDLMKATDNFNKNKIIGSGRTGTVYIATFPSGSLLAIKRLHDSPHSEKEFMSEMLTLGKVKHKNLVPLLGFCVANKERFLIYEHMDNGSVYDQLHEKSPDAETLNWPLRLKIGIGAAKGLAWLHHNCNPRILHRNISSKCILLDKSFDPRISDFGLARLMNPIDTHLSTFVNGEFGDLGYVAPEYARTLVATTKGDVYSFGVVLLELVTGETSTHVANAPDGFKGSLAEYITHLSNSSNVQDAIDKSLLGSGYDNEVFQVLKVACNCVLPAPKERPTMFEVYQLLRAIGEHYNFTVDDDLLIAPSNEDAQHLDELIVRQ